MAEINVEEKSSKGSFKWLWILIVLIVVAGILWFFFTQFNVQSEPSPGQEIEETDDIQPAMYHYIH